ncbi:MULTISPECIES: Spo0E family sporulation regulatory protein-aspartic acid phosphatase [unclassified Lysinibacillus]|uniref:Spo0E family sporulation regulatory protein-aspartic acid phosphatase n=1 Tax=unclassified Lysinibacillus TaxID=2636778 RepID=UPI0035DC8A57
MVNYLTHKQFLKMEIEIKRKIMYRKAKALGFTHPSVVDCSQELDVLLNKYSKAINKAS